MVLQRRFPRGECTLFPRASPRLRDMGLGRIPSTVEVVHLRLRCGRCRRNSIFFGLRLASTLPVVSEWLAGTFDPFSTPNPLPTYSLSRRWSIQVRFRQEQSHAQPRFGLSASFPEGGHSVLPEQSGSNEVGNRSGNDTDETDV